MKQVKIFLFGIGGYGSFYVNALSDWKDKDVVIEGICELMPGMEERFPIIRERQIPIYKSPEEFYAQHQADLAIISTPIHLHHPHVKACIAHSNVLVEKPVCAVLSEAEDMLRWEQETGHFVAVGYQLNYDRNLNALKRDILSGKLGKPVCMKALQAFKRGYNYYHRNNWAGKRIVDGCPVNDSPVNNSSAHQFQNMLFLLGDAMDRAAEVKAVEAELDRAGSYVENFDTAALKVTTAEDVPVYYYTTHNMEADQWGPMSEFCFENAVVYLGKDYGQGPLMDYVAEWKDGTVHDYGPVPTAWSMQKLEDAIECARNGGHPVCTVQAAMSHLRTVLWLSEMPVYPVSEEALILEEKNGDTFYRIRDLENIFSRCYEEKSLPGGRIPVEE